MYRQVFVRMGEKMNEKLLKYYKDQISFLVQGKKVEYGLCVDLTDDVMIAKIDQNLEFDFFDNQKIKYEIWFHDHLYKHIAYKDELNELKKIINLSYLTQQYKLSKKYFSKQHYFLWHKCLQHCKLHIHLFNNPINNHLQAYFIWIKNTERYIDEKIKNILYKNDYKALALIDISHQNIYLRLNHFIKTKKYENQYLNYQKVIDFITENQISSKYRNQFIKNASLQNLKENMRYLGHYSFKICNEKNKIERYC